MSDKFYSEDLISQLKNIPSESREIRRISENIDSNEVSEEDLEKYIIDKTTSLISSSMDVVENMKDFVYNCPNEENMSALSELIKASTNAIDVLNKIAIQNKKSKTQTKIKEMDIESKKDIQSEEHAHQYRFSRNEVLKNLIHNKDVIDISDDKES